MWGARFNRLMLGVVAWTQVRLASATHHTRQHKLIPPRNLRLTTKLPIFFGGQYVDALADEKEARKSTSRAVGERAPIDVFSLPSLSPLPLCLFFFPEAGNKPGSRFVLCSRIRGRFSCYYSTECGLRRKNSIG